MKKRKSSNYMWYVVLCFLMIINTSIAYIYTKWRLLDMMTGGLLVLETIFLVLYIGEETDK